MLQVLIGVVALMLQVSGSPRPLPRSGDYVGYVKGNTFTYQAEERIEMPGMDTTYTGVSTMKVTDSLSYDSYPAWNIRETWVLDSSITKYEYIVYLEAPYFKEELLITSNDTVYRNSLKVPFSIGDIWGSGIEGKYIGDTYYDEDTLPDTVIILWDTLSVIAQEDVEVPYGVIEDAYKVRRNGRQLLWLSQYPFGWYTVDESQDWWWKPYLGMVKDSLYVNIFQPGFNMYLMTKTELESVTGVEEVAGLPRNHCKLVSPVRDRLVIKLTLSDEVNNCSIEAYDMAGRLIGHKDFGRLSKGAHTLQWDMRVLSSGIYFIHTNVDNRVETYKIVLIK